MTNRDRRTAHAILSRESTILAWFEFECFVEFESASVCISGRGPSQGFPKELCGLPKCRVIRGASLELPPRVKIFFPHLGGGVGGEAWLRHLKKAYTTRRTGPVWPLAWREDEVGRHLSVYFSFTVRGYSPASIRASHQPSCARKASGEFDLGFQSQWVLYRNSKRFGEWKSTCSRCELIGGDWITSALLKCNFSGPRNLQGVAPTVELCL